MPHASFSITCTCNEKNFFLLIYASGPSSGARIQMCVPSIKPIMPGNPPSSSQLVHIACFSFAVKLNKISSKQLTGKFVLWFVMFCHWYSPLGHRMNRPDKSTAACDTRFRTQSTLLSVISNLSATARVGPWLAILHTKAKICFAGGIATLPDPLPSGILPVAITSRVKCSHFSLIIWKFVWEI